MQKGNDCFLLLPFSSVSQQPFISTHMQKLRGAIQICFCIDETLNWDFK